MTTSTPALIDIKTLIERRASISFSSRPTNHFKYGKEYHGPCPFCGGTDRFAVWPEAGRYSCLRGCGKYGDAIQFLRDYDDLSYHEACAELDIDPAYPEANRPPALPLSDLKDQPPNKQWQLTGMDFVQRAERYLWLEKARHALDYLHGRGLTDETIRRFYLGYCPGKFIDSLENWGIEPGQTSKSHITIPEGIIIPWFGDDHLWKIAVKRLDVPAGERSYGQVVGSSDGLYNVDSIKSGTPAMLFEGEFDALSVIQEAGDLVSVVAAGGASKAQSGRWIARLVLCSSVLIAFDIDDNQAGDSGSQDWLHILTNALRWRPLAHDGNDMLRAGMPIRLWVEIGLKTAQFEALPVSVIQTTVREVEHITRSESPLSASSNVSYPAPKWDKLNEIGVPKCCSLCPSFAVWWWVDCAGFCEKCWEKVRGVQWYHHVNK